MRVLVLGNSNDSGAWFEGGPKRTEIVRERLAAQFGEPVTVTTRGIWPNSRMAETIGRWLDEYEPDLVYMNVLTYWFTYESVPLKLKRIFGKSLGQRVGSAVGDASVKLSRNRLWSHNVAFRTGRRWAQATIGGDTNFTPEQVIERSSEAIRTIIQREGTVLLVKGSMGKSKPGLTARQMARHETRRLQVHRAISELCAQVHVRYAGTDTPEWRTAGPRSNKGMRVGDGLHSNAKGHQRSADQMHALIRDTWVEHLAALEPAPIGAR